VVSRDVLPRPSEPPPSDRGFRTEERLESSCSVLAPIGELDESTVRSFEGAVAGAVRRGRPVVIDLGRLRFIDSCGLWSITSVCSACKQRGIHVCLLPGTQRVQSVFEVTGLCDLLPFTDRLPGQAP
jgi:anti-anti-sigma factor